MPRLRAHNLRHQRGVTGGGGRLGYPPSYSLFDGLVAYWTLNEASGIRLDSSGKGLGLDVQGAITSVAGKKGDAASFPGLGRLYTSAVSDLGTTNTFSLWVNLSSQGDGSIFSKGGGSDDYFLILFSSTLSWRMYDTGAHNSLAQKLLPIGEWAFICCGFDGSRAFLSVNDSPLAKGNILSSPLPSGAATFAIGRSSTGSDLSGSVDAFSVHNRVLSPSEISTLYNGGVGYFLY